jgi:transmembrane sensor
MGLIAASFGIVAFGGYFLAPAALTGRAVIITAGDSRPRVEHLPDGSVLHLNKGAEVTVSFSDRQRRIELRKGQAYFDVAPEISRPFQVRAGGTDVVAVGTQFDIVRRGGQAITVTVIEGAVDVGRAARLEAGEQVRVDGGMHSAPEMVDLRAATAWMHREVAFDGQPLEKVVREFNRFLSTPIEVQDPGLRQLQVSGIFDTYDPESFLGFLRQYDTEIVRQQDVIQVRRRK